MESSFSWTCPFKSPTSSTSCFGEPTLGKLNQETDFYMPTHMPKPSSGANQLSVSHSSLVTKNGEHFYGKNFITSMTCSHTGGIEGGSGGVIKVGMLVWGLAGGVEASGGGVGPKGMSGDTKPLGGGGGWT